MKRRHYRIHYNDKTRPMRRVKHREIPWGSIMLALLALLLVAAAVFAVFRWFDLGGGENPFTRVLEP
ncbi:MAG: hypothetical protein K6G56_06140 [Clostridiales bacterium]|nr:hypothetical protein [Clostridiales bacterium]